MKVISLKLTAYKINHLPLTYTPHPFSPSNKYVPKIITLPHPPPQTGLHLCNPFPTLPREEEENKSSHVNSRGEFFRLLQKCRKPAMALWSIANHPRYFNDRLDTGPVLPSWQHTGRAHTPRKHTRNVLSKSMASALSLF